MFDPHDPTGYRRVVYFGIACLWLMGMMMGGLVYALWNG